MNDICNTCGKKLKRETKENEATKPTKEVVEAMLHVQSRFPEVIYVVYGVDSRWQYLDDDFYAPKFADKDQINTSLLEEAVDSLSDLPAIFYLPNNA